MPYILVHGSRQQEVTPLMNLDEQQKNKMALIDTYKIAVSIYQFDVFIIEYINMAVTVLVFMFHCEVSWDH